jgi:23S rRNA (uracil-5-)-methyltransferase RumA
LGKNKKDWAEGYPVQFHSYSKERVEPFCQHFGVCGGCQWQMLPYAKQLEYKQKQVYDNLKRIGKIKLPDLMPIIGSEEDKFYRNKLEYTFSTKEYTTEKPSHPTSQRSDSAAVQPLLSNETLQDIKSPQSRLGVQGIIPTENRVRSTSESTSPQPSPGGEGAAVQPLLSNETGNYNVSLQSGPFERGEVLPTGEGLGGASVLGFHAKGFFDKIVDIKKCWLQDDLTNDIRNGVREFALENNLSFYDIRAHRGLLRTMQVRICTTGEVMVNIVFGNESEKQRTKVLEYVKNTFPEITTLLYTINLKMNDSMHDLEPQVYTGKGFIMEHLEEFVFKIGPKSFFQTNTKQAERLYSITREFAELDGSQTVYDLYCGTGSIGIFCSKGAKKIVGVEMQAAAVEDAKENATINNIPHSFFVSGDVINICNDAFFDEHGKPDVIITDPPRAGMHQKLIEKILEIEAPTVVYVSCNPATQARDLNLLDEKYAVTKVQPVDMFPHTHHIENIVQLKLK